MAGYSTQGKGLMNGLALKGREAHILNSGKIWLIFLAGCGRIGAL